ncbi:Hypothetical predicted protein [Mytilus galloprovincialis]|uniref:Uncharacterized protein n=1 Tax=Mytilus galloprovincialis TaxID=29158 RepID=A0A8B6DD94_MYTGA|nr:Hypothetical predicted protein [Mytilus galloprovincialis]
MKVMEFCNPPSRMYGNGNIFVFPDLQLTQALKEVDWISLFDIEDGSSTVAIDNKIEQAMDLVKSHLMYAVREEVEVLKEQIKELMDKNQQLEYENQILKNSASPETLSKLTSPSSSS